MPLFASTLLKVQLTLIFVDGVVLGMARRLSQSLYEPIVMQLIGNLFAIYQSLHSFPGAYT